ncbi:MAG TPA: ubiquitin-conjugating enzyme E2 [Tepidisphaeraceae bacterium]
MAVSATEAIPAKLPLRLRRLHSDAKQMATAFKSFPLIRVIKATGDPPDLYEIEYLVRSLERGKNNKPVPRELHRVEIQLTSDYPRLAPHCRMLTPVFHPNIDPSTICVGDHWAAGERLANLVVRIGELLAYQAYNIKSPLDAEAAMWADLNTDKLPIDPRNLHPVEL